MNNNRRSPAPLTRKLTVLAVSLILSATCLSARSQASATNALVLRSVDAQPAPDGTGMRVTFEGSNPLPFSLSPIEGGNWSMTLEGVDCSDVQRDMPLGTAGTGHLMVRSVYGIHGSSSTRVEFTSPAGSDRKVSLDGNKLIVDLTEPKPAAAPSQAEP
jgi:hypothetical protein